jgi:hypothetical protein
MGIGCAAIALETSNPMAQQSAVVPGTGLFIVRLPFEQAGNLTRIDRPRLHISGGTR